MVKGVTISWLILAVQNVQSVLCLVGQWNTCLLHLLCSIQPEPGRVQEGGTPAEATAGALSTHLMAAIRDFFNKRKAQLKFKQAGPGHVLSGEGAHSRAPPGPSRVAAPTRALAPPSQEAQRAAAAALARLERSHAQANPNWYAQYSVRFQNVYALRVGEVCVWGQVPPVGRVPHWGLLGTREQLVTVGLPAPHEAGCNWEALRLTYFLWWAISATTLMFILQELFAASISQVKIASLKLSQALCFACLHLSLQPVSEVPGVICCA